ncbi:hypothetical protein V5O48_013214 [Marasmius crinis-equi]|uniref:HECT domain-containing protein n=1 Tax=Marasmius crinis-equi TaxID=585013 RepID=A0ABR3F0V2_9AGAR
MTIAELLTRSEFALEKLSITPRKYLELNTVVRSCHYPLPIKTSLASLQLGADSTEKEHRCISNRVYSLFRDDTDFDESMGMASEEVLEEECGEEGDIETDEEEQAVEQTLTNPNALRISALPTPAPGIAQNRSSSAPSSSASALPASANTQRSASASGLSDPDPPTPFNSGLGSSSLTNVSSSNPRVKQNVAILKRNAQQAAAVDVTNPIWTTPWEDQVDSGLPTIYNFERTTRIFELVTEVFADNNDGRPPTPLSLRGVTIQELASKLRMVILRCVFNKDFGQLLNLDREFRLVDEDGTSVSSGNGVETEVFHTLFHSYFVDRAGEFFAPLTDVYATLAAVNGSSSQWMSVEQKQDWSVLGALCAMSLIYGRGTDPLNPLLLIYLINDCDLKSLHSDLVLRLDPQLHHTLKTWKQTSHLDNVSSFAGHFTSFHDIQVSTLRTRTPVQHNTLGWEMLHNTVIGSRTVEHPAFSHFLKGFRLPCARGYDLTQIARAFQGGPENFVSKVYANYIAQYSDLALSHISRLQPETESALTNALSANASLEATNFEELFKDFLQERGYPSLDLMEEIKGRFNPVVNLDGIFDETFRLRMFCWATTGAPLANTDGVSIKVILVEDSDAEYRSNLPSEQVQSNLNAGVCKFRTCARQVRIPASFLIHLLSTSRDAEVLSSGGSTGIDPLLTQTGAGSSGLTIRETLHHWLLASILDNIGQNNVA